MSDKSALNLLLFCAAAVNAAGDDEYSTAWCDGKQVIVHLFEWKWSDIAAECERFLAPAGFCAVQVSPPMEHVVLPADGFPWWQRYQPVSYLLTSRSGDENEFTDMVTRCNAVGVRIIVDAVVNHMAGLGRVGPGSAGSAFDSDNLDFPGVPYSSVDFTPRDLCPSGSGEVDNYQDPNNIRNCYLVGLTDLYQASSYVRQKIADYYNHLIAIGVMGFRVDASKHMWPDDLTAIQGMTDNLNTAAGFPANARPFFYHEVIDQGGEPITVNEYYTLGWITEFRYCSKISSAMNDYSQLASLYDPGWNMANNDNAFIFVDNHDNQRSGGSNILTYKNGRTYANAVVYTIAQDYGFTRIMSSYAFDNSDQGPPANGEDTDSVIINADNTCGGGWVCEHRWNSIYRIVPFRTATADEAKENWYQVGDTVAFSRGNKGFFAMNKNGALNTNLQTGLPAGDYCDLITDCAKIVTVNADGTADIIIDSYDDPYVAICVGCDGSSVTSDPNATLPPTQPPITSGTHRTVIFIYKETQVGQNLFLRGGIGETQRPGCTLNDAENDICAIDMEVQSLGTEVHYDEYNSWRVGDTKLDWYGAQVGQGTFGGEVPEGTPLAWTTNVVGADGYQSLNIYGQHYWMVDTLLDCSQTENGWFEVKAYVTNGDGWESDINQSSSCSGSVGGRAPYSSINHLAKCGFVNVFTFSSPSCKIEDFTS